MGDRVFPARGVVWKVLEKQLWELKAQDNDWDREILGGITWPDPGGNIHLVAKEAGNIFFNNLLLGRYTQPSVRRVSEDVAHMAGEILNLPQDGHCTLTYGGTESNFLGVLAARNWAREHRPGATKPEILAPYTAHPSFNKAAHYLGLEVVRVPQGPDFRADVAAMARAVNDNTVMIVGSAPPYPHGKVDPISAIASLAREHGCGATSMPVSAAS